LPVHPVPSSYTHCAIPAPTNNNNSIKFFINLRAELNSRWPISESAPIRTTAIRQHRTKQTKQETKKKMNRLRLLKLKHDLLKISIDLQTAFAADTHLAEGQWLKEELNVVKLRTFRVGT
jgi:hypothetical protein